MYRKNIMYIGFDTIQGFSHLLEVLDYIPCKGGGGSGRLLYSQCLELRMLYGKNTVLKR
jgi:hypothetical protein